MIAPSTLRITARLNGRMKPQAAKRTFDLLAALAAADSVTPFAADSVFSAAKELTSFCTAPPGITRSIVKRSRAMNFWESLAQRYARDGRPGLDRQLLLTQLQ